MASFSSPSRWDSLLVLNSSSIPVPTPPTQDWKPLVCTYHHIIESRWERWSEEAYEGWGWSGGDKHGLKEAVPSTNRIASAEEVDGYSVRGNSSFGALFRHPGVVYPIHPTGHMRLPRPKLPFVGGVGGGPKGGDPVTFVVQVKLYVLGGEGYVTRLRVGDMCIILNSFLRVMDN